MLHFIEYFLWEEPKKVISSLLVDFHFNILRYLKSIVIHLLGFQHKRNGEIPQIKLFILDLYKNNKLYYLNLYKF